MANYKCFFCGKSISSNVLGRKIICPSCGGRIFFKPREEVKKVKAV